MIYVPIATEIGLEKNNCHITSIATSIYRKMLPIISDGLPSNF